MTQTSMSLKKKGSLYSRSLRHGSIPQQSDYQSQQPSPQNAKVPGRRFATIVPQMTRNRMNN